MTVDKLNKRIEKQAKQTQTIKIIDYVWFSFLGVGGIVLIILSTIEEYIGFAVWGVVLLLFAVGLLILLQIELKKDNSLEKLEAWKKHLLESEDEIRRRVGLYQAADEEQKKCLKSAYQAERSAYQEKGIAVIDMLAKYSGKRRLENSTAKGLVGAAVGGATLGYIAHRDAEKRNEEIRKKNFEVDRKVSEAEEKISHAEKKIAQIYEQMWEIESEIEQSKNINVKDWSYNNYKDFEWSNVGKDGLVIVLEGVEYRVENKGIGLKLLIDRDNPFMPDNIPNFR